MRFLLLLSIATLLSLPTQAVEQFGYKVLERKPQDRANYVQGLEIVDGDLYVSSGGYGKSRFRRYDFESGELRVDLPLDPRIFAEGLTVFGDNIYQLTWQNRVGLIYDRKTLVQKQLFRIPGQGWGLTHNGKELIYSDGSDRLFFLSPDTNRITRHLAVTENGNPVTQINELEWIDGAVWANVWKSDRIVIIDPDSGKVTGSIDLQGLNPPDQYTQVDDVLNGIARNPADGAIWVTGKRWPWLYRIELVPKTVDEPTQNPTESR
jgi:glutamine cyclotransferase